MTRRCRQSRSGILFPAFPYKFTCLAAVWLLAASVAHALPGEVEPSDCENMSGTHYLINIEDIAMVSGFYQQISERYFKELKDFEGIVGERRRVETYYDFRNLQI